MPAQQQQGQHKPAAVHRTSCTICGSTQDLYPKDNRTAVTDSGADSAPRELLSVFSTAASGKA